MSDNKHDNNIDWDKLADLLEGEGSLEGLTEEELRALAASREMKARLAQPDFSVEEGWQQFNTARTMRRARIIRMAKVAAAAVVIAISTGFWMMRSGKELAQQPVQLANAKPSGKVQLKLNDGRTITLGAGQQTIQHGSEAQIKAGTATLAYTGSNTNAVVTMDTLEVPRGLQFSLQLADGSMVWLNSDTRLSYPAVFNGRTREVYVEGEAFFDVKPNVEQPFIVHAGNNSMKVLGTSFNVNTFDRTITTTLSTGRLMVAAEGQQRLLNPGEQTVYSNGELEKQEVDTHIYTAWKEGDLFFEDATLLSISRYLARNYDYDFEFKDRSLEKLRFTLDMRRPAHLQDALDLISKSMGNISFNVHNKTVQVNKLADKNDK